MSLRHDDGPQRHDQPGGAGQDPVGEHDLHALFARRRPDPARFAAGVAERLRERDRGDDAGAVPKAAGLAPLPGSAAKLWALLSLPIVFLASSWLAMIGSARVIRSALRAGAEPDAGAREAVVLAARPGPWRLPSLRQRSTAMLRRPLQVALFWLALVAATTGLAFAGWPYVFDGLIVAGVLSMFALAMQVRGEARRGRADRAEVARLCIGLLQVVLVMTIVHWLVGPHGSDAGQWVVASWLVVAAGILGLARYAPLHAWISLGTVAYLVVLMQFDGFRVDQDPPVTMAEVEHYVAQPELGRDGARVRHYVGVVGALRAAGHQATPPDDLGRELIHAEHEILSYGARELTACARADLLPDREWQRIAAIRRLAHRLDRFLASAEPTLPPEYEEYLFRMLAVRPLTDVDRDRLTARLTANWPGDDSRTPLAECRLICNALDWLGRRDLVDAQRALVHRCLVRQQQRSGFGVGGFTELPATATIDSPLPADDLAMALIARLGLPPDLDVHALRRHLQREARVPDSEHLILRDQAYAAFAHLQLLDALVGPLPARSFVRTLIDERLLWSMLALVLLCLYAVWLAPPQLPTGRHQGAMP